MSQYRRTTQSIISNGSIFKCVLRRLGTYLLFMHIAIGITWGASNFKIDSIHIIGLERLSKEAVLHQLPYHVGDWFDVSKSDELLKILYKTQWFKSVRIERQGASLKLILEEQPIISQITLKGDHSVPQDALDKSLKELGLIEGGFYNPSALELLKKTLIYQYALLGKHAVKINTVVEPETPRVVKKSKTIVDAEASKINTVTDSVASSIVKIVVNIDIGPTLKFSSIRLWGPKDAYGVRKKLAFEESRILEELPVTASHALFALMRDKSKQCTALVRQQALVSLIQFYKNHGYADVKVNANWLSITPDYRYADWIIELTEGVPYKIKNYRILGESYGLTEKQLKTLLHFKQGDTYSEKAITRTKNAIQKHFGRAHYIFAKAKITPHFDHKAQCVSLAIQIEPGEKTYVRRVNIEGNRYIREDILHSLMLQPEASAASKEDFDESEQNLLQSRLVDHVSIDPVKVGSANDQVDLAVKVHEVPRKFVGMNPLGLDFGDNGIIWHTDLNLENTLGSSHIFHVKAAKTPYLFNAELSHSGNYIDVLGFKGLGYHMRADWTNYQKWDYTSWFKRSPYIRSMNDHIHSFTDVMNSIGEAISHLWTEKAEKALPSPEEGKSNSTSEQQNTTTEEDKTVERSKFEFDSWRLAGDIDIPTSWQIGKFWRLSVERRSRYFSLSEKNKDYAQQIKSFFDNYGKQVDQWIFQLGRHHDQLRRHIFYPIRGSQFHLSGQCVFSRVGELDKNIFKRIVWWDNPKPLHYFKLNYSSSHFWNLGSEDNFYDTTIGLRCELGVGQQWSGGGLPFFDAYYSGRVYGYEYDSLGPQDNLNKMLGGSLLFKAQVMWFLPKPLSGRVLRIANLAWPYRSNIFLQMANVWELNSFSSLKDPAFFGKYNFPFVCSVGGALEVTLQLPIVGITLPGFISFAAPIFDGRVQAGGEKRYFTFGMDFMMG
jgi:outer membrane protein assembly complex protein YaeT